MRPRGARALTAAQQYFHLRRSPLGNGEGCVQRGRLLWEYTALPTPLSRTYEMRIEFRERHSPDVRCVAPDLMALAGGKKLPHVYAGTPPKLCLYTAKLGDWDPSRPIADTIVPWSYEWLFYYEHWLATGIWEGGGTHPVSQ